MKHLQAGMAGLALVVAGLCAAGLSHTAVWSLTALGAVSGPYTSYRHDALISALLGAAAIAVAIGVIALGCSFAACVRGGDAWFAALFSAILAFGMRRSSLATILVQFGAIVGIERIEQVARFGHTLGLGAAFGAPVLIAVALQMACALFVVASLFAFARAVVRAEALVRAAFAPMLRVRANGASVIIGVRYQADDAAVRFGPHRLRLFNRPPPSIAA